MLWFDVENKRYTTAASSTPAAAWLWFDVENKRYTTQEEEQA